MALEHSLGVLQRLFNYWWRADRVRIAPAEGRLLDLDPRTIISIDRSIYEIVEKKLAASEQHVQVDYRCNGEHGQGRLRVTLEPERLRTRVVWSCRGADYQLDARDITVFA